MNEIFEEELVLEGYESRNIIIPRSKKNYSYELENIFSESYIPFIWYDTRLCLENEKIFDFWKNDFDIIENLHFNDHRYIHYAIVEEKRCSPFFLKIENICGIIERGENEDRNHYFKPTALLQTSYIHEIFAKIQQLTIEQLNINYHDMIDSVKFEIDSNKKLPLNKIIYLKNIIVVFEKVEKIKIKRRKKHKIIARIISGEILLNKK